MNVTAHSLLHKAIAATLTSLLLATTVARADTILKDTGCVPTKALRFAPGATSRTIEGAIVNQGMDCYTLTARAGQTLDVDIASPSDNVVVTIFEPPLNYTRGENDFFALGTLLPGATNDDLATKLSKMLPKTGTYLLVFGVARQDYGSYDATVSVK